jgi:carboxypeptidase C (cathepsin A)
VNRVLRLALLAAGLLTVSITAWSQDAPAKLDKADKSDKADRKPVDPKDTVRDTAHKITLNGQPLNYLASAGTLVLRDAAAAVQGAFTGTFNEYVRNDLKVENDLTYEILTGKVQPWDYGNAKNRYVNVAPTLRSAMTTNHDLRLFVANGYYDLATPFAATDYTLAHLGLDAPLCGNVTTAYYEAGHMIYIDKPSHDELRRDLVAFLRGGR